ncbi:rod-binding protein [Aureimonas mangrovi]|uniref:rod-binding protein n=1 Tax=Aureimonas mangrovi TaxID=2758041 RepID=UPI00163D8227|nr:rod-binding protein [Aureimonas mangrovi]
MTIIQPLAVAGTASATVLSEPAAKVSSGDGAMFSAALDKAAATLPVSSAPLHTRAKDPLQEFEGFVLRSFVEEMLPKENTEFFGAGMAGDVWRSMMAEKIGEEIAAAGGIGIADMLAQSPTLAGRAAEVAAAEDDRLKAAGAAKI